MKLYLEYVEGTSSKFWSVEVSGSSHTVVYGRIGSKGRAKTTEFDSSEAALADASKQAAGKRKKGYVDAEPGPVEAGSATAAKPGKTSTKKTAKTSTKKTAKKASKTKAPSERTLKSFFKAMREGNLAKVTAELDRAIDPNTTFDIQGNGEPWSLLYHAVFHRQHAIANLLLDRGAVPSGEILHNVADAALAKRLIDAGADVNATTDFGSTPLHQVADVAVAETLIAAGARVDARDSDGLSPFERTTSVALRDLLLTHGATGLLETNGDLLPLTPTEVEFEAVDATRGAIGVADDGALWFGGYSGLFRVAEGRVTRYPTTMAIEAIASAHGVVYIATNQGLLGFCDGVFRQYTPNNSGLHDGHITHMSVVDDLVYCVGYESGAETKHLSVFDGRSWRLLRPGSDLPERCDVCGVMRDAAGRLVLADQEEGGVYVQTSDGWVYDSLGADIFTPRVYVMASRDGFDYFGTHSGLLRRAPGAALEQIAGGAFSALAWIGDTMWAATSWDGVYALRGGDLLERYDEARTGLGFNNVEGMMATPDGRLFVSTGNHLLVARDGEFSPVREPPAAARAELPVEPRELPGEPLVAAALLPPAWVDAASTIEIDGLELGALTRVVMPAIGLALADAPVPVGGSKLGGLPDLPRAVAWPRYPDEDDHLPFVLQLDCAELQPHDVAELLPREGHLYLFADTSPEAEDAFAVIYAKGPVEPRPLPEDLVERRSVSDAIVSFSEQALRPFTQYTLPSLDWFRAGALGDAAAEAITSLREMLQASTEWSTTQILGWPDPVQGEFVGDCETVTLIQLDALTREFGSWIVDGLRYWMVDREALAKPPHAKPWSAVWAEYQYT